MKGPWVKLWRNVFSDEKVAFLMRRYGHEAGIMWIGILSQAEDGVLSMEEDIFADLIQIEEKRYIELRGVLIKRGLVTENDQGQLVIPNWEEYQVGESTDRVKAFRERKKAQEAPKQPENDETLRNGCATEKQRVEVEVRSKRLEEEKNTHIASEKTEPMPEQEPEPILEPPEPDTGTDYPKKLFEAWTSLGDKAIQPPNYLHWLNAVFPRIHHRLAGIHSRDVAQALANYREILHGPSGKYFWDARLSAEIFFDRHLVRFLPTNFNAADFFKRDIPPSREVPRQSLVETYEPIPDENKRIPTQEELAEVEESIASFAAKHRLARV